MPEERTSNPQSLHTLFGEVQSLRIGIAHVLVPMWMSVDWGAMLIAVGATVAMFRYKIGMMPTLGGAAALGVLIEMLG